MYGTVTIICTVDGLCLDSPRCLRVVLKIQTSRMLDLTVGCGLARKVGPAFSRGLCQQGRVCTGWQVLSHCAAFSDSYSKSPSSEEHIHIFSGVFGSQCRNVDQARPDVTFGRCLLCIDAETPERMSMLCRFSRRANLNLNPGYRTETDRAICLFRTVKRHG